MTGALPSLVKAKEQAKTLRAQLADEGKTISHSRALEMIAAQLGFRDWNAASAAIERQMPAGWRAGDRVQGHYLSQPFTATVLSATLMRPGWYRVTLDLEKAVDAVTFDSFSAFRKRISGVVGPAGQSHEKTSNGRPQLELKM